LLKDEFRNQRNFVINELKIGCMFFLIKTYRSKSNVNQYVETKSKYEYLLIKKHVLIKKT